MKLSIIIVNYNVEYFLEQCLNSVYKALGNVEGEVFVVDNNSIDSSVEMVEKKFPQVKLIANKENFGFSQANNQAIKISSGEYVLLLNPDTVVEEDTFERVVEFMDENPDAGGLGVKMLDGKGKFLPESKRGLPTPAVAFYKIFGFSRIFPRSKRFSQYHLGYLDNDEVNEIEILSGAFMLMRKAALDKVGLLDEAFFMYGEDIDLSYRIIKGGYKNYYFPKTRIIHYKGESTKKSSINYVFVFYNAMIIFAKKHFSEKNARLFSFFINMAIYLRASVAIVNRFAKRSIVPLIDAALIGVGLAAITHFYQEFTNKDLPNDIVTVALSSYGIIWMLSVFLSGGYDKPIRIFKIFRGVAIGTGIILMVYALLSKDYQFSRVIILLGAVWAFVAYTMARLLYHGLKLKRYNLSGNPNKRFAIIGQHEEAERVSNLLTQTRNKTGYIGIVNTESTGKKEGFIGDVSQLQQIVDIHKIDEIVFCAKDNTSQQIIDLMSRIHGKNLDYKIAQPESLYLIGSNSIDSSGDLYVLDINSVSKPSNKRNKRLFDFTIALLLLPLLPILLVLVRKPIGLFRNIFTVLFGRKSWVGYSNTPGNTNFKLPKIKKGILSPMDTLPEKNHAPETAKKLNIIYAKDYRVTTDLNLLLKGIKKIGR
jgi:GT2 family glycosyltransferase